jgi:hypothetical protein
LGRFRKARETVQMESPERAATSWMVTRGILACSTEPSPFFPLK